MGQLDLFQTPTAAAQIPGFTLELDYISPSEEQTLLTHIENEPWESDWRRRIQQFGIGYASQHGGVPAFVRPFPRWLTEFAQRIHNDAPFERLPENCVINEYIPPLGIAPHKDYPAFGPTIACVSLGSDIVIDFENPAKRLRISVFVPARSFWVITGEARSGWTHGIAPRLTDLVNGVRRPRGRRVSVTFRTANVSTPD